MDAVVPPPPVKKIRGKVVDLVPILKFLRWRQDNPGVKCRSWWDIYGRFCRHYIKDVRMLKCRVASPGCRGEQTEVCVQCFTVQWPTDHKH